MKNSWEPAFWVFLQWSNLYLLERRKTKSLFFCMCTQSLCISRPYTQYQRHKGRFWLNSIGMILTFRSPHGNDLYIVLGWPKRSFGFFVASFFVAIRYLLEWFDCSPFTVMSQEESEMLWLTLPFPFHRSQCVSDRPTCNRTAAASWGDRVPTGNGVRLVMVTGHPQGD